MNQDRPGIIHYLSTILNPAMIYRFFEWSFVVVVAFCLPRVLYAQDTLTVGEIYQFEAGDEFHYITEHAYFEITPGWIIRKIMQVDTTGEAIIYTFSYNDSNGNSGVDTWDIPLEALNWHIDDSIQMRKNRSATPGSEFPDSMYAVQMIIDSVYLNRRGNFISYSEGALDNWEPDSYVGWYLPGLGHAVRTKSTIGNGSWKHEMVYYKKSDGEWGTPLAVSPIPDMNFSISPNPTPGRLTILCNCNSGDDWSVRITRTDGNVIYDSPLAVKEIDLPEPGVYFVTVYNASGNYRVKKLVVY